MTPVILDTYRRMQQGDPAAIAQAAELSRREKAGELTPNDRIVLGALRALHVKSQSAGRPVGPSAFGAHSDLDLADPLTGRPPDRVQVLDANGVLLLSDADVAHAVSLLQAAMLYDPSDIRAARERYRPGAGQPVGRSGGPRTSGYADMRTSSPEVTNMQIGRHGGGGHGGGGRGGGGRGGGGHRGGGGFHRGGRGVQQIVLRGGGGNWWGSGWPGFAPCPFGYVWVRTPYGPRLVCAPPPAYPYGYGYRPY